MEPAVPAVQGLGNPLTDNVEAEPTEVTNPWLQLGSLSLPLEI
jgi:hypothetical protein